MIILKFVESKNKEILNVLVSLETKEWNNIIINSKKELGKNLKIDGFRTGNIPVNLLDKYIPSNKILYKAEEKGLDFAFKKTKEQKNKELIFFRFTKKMTKKISFSEFEVEFELERLPTINLKKYKDFNVSIKSEKISKKEIEDLINKKKEDFSILVEKGEIAEKNSIVNIDFEGFINNKKDNDITTKKYSLELGSNKFIKGFEDSIVGMKKNETKEVKLKFPKKYEPKYAEKEVVFKITLNKVEQKKEISIKELIEKLNLKTKEDLEKKIIEEFKIKQKEEEKHELIFKINKEILKNAEINIPNSYFEREFKILKDNQIYYLKNRNIELKDFLKNKKMSLEEFDKDLKKRTIETIKELLVYHEIAKKENIEISNEEMEGYYKMLSEYTRKDIKEIKKVYSWFSIHNSFLKNKVEEFLINNNNKK